MSLYDLSSLYKEVIMDHSNYPRYKKVLEAPTHRIELLNPTCGDAIVVEMVVEDNDIQSIAFNGQGCAISMASADMMCQSLLNKPIQEAVNIIGNFAHLIGGETLDKDLSDTKLMTQDELMKYIGDAYLLESLKKFPSRYKCGILAWRATEMALTQAPKQEPTNI